MKKTFSFLMVALLAITFVACKKDKDNNDQSKKDLVSVWELAETSSMLPVRTYDPGNGNILKINSDGTYAYSVGGQVTEQGDYTIVPDTSVENEVCLTNLKDKYKNRFDVTNVTPAPTFTPSKTFFYVENDKLYMIGGCFAYDAGSLRVYRRANPIAID